MGIEIFVAFDAREFRWCPEHLWSHTAQLFPHKDALYVVDRKIWECMPERPSNVIVLSGSEVPLNLSHQGSKVRVIPKSVNECSNLLHTNNMTSETVYMISPALCAHYMDLAHRVHVLVTETASTCQPFDISTLEPFEIDRHMQLSNHMQLLTYKYAGKRRHDERHYLDLLTELTCMNRSRPDRTGVGTFGVFGRQLRFDISRTIPLLTTKFVPWKLTVKELLWFIRGQTNSKLLESQGVHIWSGNTSRTFLDARGLTHYAEGDTGPMYGFNWRHFGATYQGCHADHTDCGTDQLARLIQGLKTDPYSRRHMITTYDPSTVDQGVLAPCHGIVVQFHVEEGDPQQLSCQMYQRSCDTFLGCPINIASYAILTHMIAKMCDMVPKELVLVTGDTHLYTNHVAQAREQITRSALPFPILKIDDRVKEKTLDEITLEDFQVLGYLHHPSIRAPMAV